MNKLHSEITFIFNNELMILLVTISAIVSIFAVLPAIKGSSEYANRFKVAVVLAVIVGFILGILDSASFILSNRYLQLKMNHLVITSALSIINKYLLIAIGIGVFVFIMLIATRAFLKVIGLNRRASEIIRPFA